LKSSAGGDDLTDAGKKAAEARLETDLSGGTSGGVSTVPPLGMRARRCVELPRPDAATGEPCIRRAPNLSHVPDARRRASAHAHAVQGVQQKNKDIGEDLPAGDDLGSPGGVQGGAKRRARTRGWLECSKDCWSEINPRAANDRGIRDGRDGVGKTPTAQIQVKAMETDAPTRHRLCVPLLRPLAGPELEAYYPDGAAPVMRRASHRDDHATTADDDARDEDDGCQIESRLDATLHPIERLSRN